MRKVFLVAALAVSFCAHAQDQKGTLKGVVTYYFNDNFGDKPDVGAEVYVLPFKDFKQEYADSLNAYHSAEITWNSYRRTPSRKDKNKYREQLTALNAYPEERFSDMYSNLLTMRRKIQNCDNVAHTYVDGVGTFSIDIPSGDYFLMYLSAHDHNAIDLGFAKVKAGETSNINQQFR